MSDYSHACQVMGLKEGASAEEARQAYRDLVKVWHPDRFGHDERLRLIAQNKLKEINGAYKVIQSQLFESGINGGQSSQEGSSPPPGSESSPPRNGSAVRNRTVMWVSLVLLALAVVAVGGVLFLQWSHSRMAFGSHDSELVHTTDGPSRSVSFNNGGGRIMISTTGSLAGTFTVECWALTRKPKGTDTILCSRGPKDFGFNIKFRQGKRFHADIGDGSRWLSKMANAKFSYNRNIWYHIAYVVTPADYTVYVNGDSWAQGRMDLQGLPLLYDPDHQLWLGADAIDGDPLDGEIAEVRIWSTARTGEQIRSTLNSTLSGNEQGLQACWRFEEVTGVTAKDQSGHGFLATLSGDCSWSTNGPSIVRR